MGLNLKCKIIRTRDDQGQELENLEIVASPPGRVEVGINKEETRKYSSNYRFLQFLFRK